MTGDLTLAQIQLGHKRITTMAKIYTHANNRLIERAGEVLAGAILDTNGTQNDWFWTPEVLRKRLIPASPIKKAGYQPALIAGEGFEPPTFGL
jgi:hypothetical protein